jgi:hypothetical protein
MRGITIWRILDGRIREEWSSYSELDRYLQVARHLRWFLMAVAGAGIIGVIVFERLLWKLLRIAWRRSHHEAT